VAPTTAMTTATTTATAATAAAATTATGATIATATLATNDRHTHTHTLRHRYTLQCCNHRAQKRINLKLYIPAYI